MQISETTRGPGKMRSHFYLHFCKPVSSFLRRAKDTFLERRLHDHPSLEVALTPYPRLSILVFIARHSLLFMAAKDMHRQRLGVQLIKSRPGDSQRV